MRYATLDDQQPHIVLDARNEKTRRGATIPLRPGLAEDLRRWIGTRRDGLLFRISANQIKTFNRELRFAAVPKRDERGRVVCIHSLRHSFATLLSRGGVAPRVAQAAMRHASVEMTLQTYTDPKLLDVAAALHVLPELPLGASLAATGTNSLAP